MLYGLSKRQCLSLLAGGYLLLSSAVGAKSANASQVWQEEFNTTINSSSDGFDALVKVDSAGNARLGWGSELSPYKYLHHTRMDSAGGIVTDKGDFVLDALLMGIPSLGIDSSDNSHIAAVASNCKISYFKLDSGDNVTVSTTPAYINDGGSNIVLDIDSSDDVHIAWSSRFYNDTQGPTKIGYVKVDGQTGAPIVTDWVNHLNPKPVGIVIADLSPSFCHTPGMEVDSSDNLHIAWKVTANSIDTSGNIYYTKLNNTGGAIVASKSIAVTADTSPDALLDLEIDSVGDIYVAWGESTGVYFYKMNSNGAELEPKTLLVSGNAQNSKVDIEVDDSGNIHIVYDSEYVKLDSALNPLGFYTTPGVNASLALDGSGSVYFAWEEGATVQCVKGKLVEPLTLGIEIILHKNGVPVPSGTIFNAGDTVSVYARLTNDETADTVDIKIWFELAGMVDKQSIARVPDVLIDANLDALTDKLFEGELTSSDTPGTYSFGGRFLDNIAGEYLSTDTATVIFTP